MRILSLLVLVFLGVGGVCLGSEGPRVTNEMIYEKLLEMEKRQAVLEAQFREFKEQIDKRFEQVDKRFEQVDRRFEQVDRRISELREDMDKRFAQVDQRFEELRSDMNARFDQLYTFLWIITGIFSALVAVVIGFALWDRRTTIRRAREEAFEKVEAEGRWRLVLEALRELAREDRRLAEVLRNFGLL